MHSFHPDYLEKIALPISCAWLLSDIAEAKGRQRLFERQKPQILAALRERALVQSIESSNRIEGIVVAPARLHPLILEDAEPRDRSEEEIRNYRDALRLVHAEPERLAVTPKLVLHLHAMVQKGSGDAGEWKAVDNEIIEMREDGLPQVRFRPVSAAETPRAVTRLCEAYQEALVEQRVPPLLAVACLILDFLCIHPFRDGNGRVSRLLTLLTLYHHGFKVGRYISLERLVEESREDYYEALRQSSVLWHEGKHDPLPWFHFFLAALRRACRVFEHRAEDLGDARGTKTARIEAVIASFGEEFSLGQLLEACPNVSRDLVRRVLQNLRKAGKVVSRGRGRGAHWERLDEEWEAEMGLQKRGETRGTNRGTE